MASLFACLHRFLFRCYPPHRNIQWRCKNLLFKGQMSWFAKINRTFVLVTKTVHHTFTHWSFWEILFYADTLIVYNLHIKFRPRKNFWSWDLSLLFWVVGSVKLQDRPLLCELVLSHEAPAVSIHNSKPSIVKLSCEEIWQFHFWNFNGYSDLSTVEGIVGKGRGEMGKGRYMWKECVSHEVVVGVKHRERICSGRKWKPKRI